MVEDTRQDQPGRTTLLARAVPPTKYSRLGLLLSCGTMLVLFLPGCLMCVGLEVLATVLTRPALAAFCAVCAVLFAIPHFLVILWLDRNEREPIYLVLTSLFWGGVMATGASGLLNTINGVLFQSMTLNPSLANQMTASLSAPPVEEITKGLALLFIYLFFTKELDSILDGIVYGALVGLGFAVFENYTYYFNAGAAESNSVASFASATLLVYVRGVITGIGTHACFTAMTGAGFGAFRVMRSGVLRWFMPVIGLTLAIFSHFAWNTFTGLFMFAPENLGVTMFVSLPLAVVVLQFPFLLLVFVTAGFALRHERNIIEKYLHTERKSVVDPSEITNLVPYRRKLFFSLRLLMAFNVHNFFHQRKRQKLLIKLALERWHMDKEDQLGDTNAAHSHAVRVTALRRQLLATPLNG